MRIVYTVSTGYSGSTLLAMLMNAHPETAGVGELQNSVGVLLRQGNESSYPCSCGEEIGDCPFWREVRERCHARGVELDLHDFRTQLDLGLGNAVNRLAFGIPARGALFADWRDAGLARSRRYRQTVDSVLDRNLTIARAVLELTGKDVFFDASKNPRIAARLAHREDVELHLVQLIRDPRAVLSSTLKRNPTASVEAMARHWVRLHRGVEWFTRHLPPNRIFRLRYETLCSEPGETIRSLCQFLGLQEVELIDAAKAQDHHLIGNDMRKQRFEGVRLDDSWRQRLNDAQMSKVVQIAGDLARDLGYEL